MPLKPLPDQGIEVPLSEYNRLRAFQGGGWFWDHDNQQIIREALGDFLPRVEERRDKGGALFQQFVRGVEATSRSQAVGAQMNRVPKSEYHRLQRALENLKLKAQNPGTDPNARRVIEKFCLPDPAKDPDLYRLYGSRWNRRLLVLWGCEREEGSSLAPSAALTRMPVEPAAASFVRRLPLWLGLLLLLLLLALGLREVWQRNRSTTGERSPLAMSDSSLPQTAAPDGGAASSVSGTALPSNGGTTLGNPPAPGNASAPLNRSEGTRTMPYLADNVRPAGANPASSTSSGNPPNNQPALPDNPMPPDAAMTSAAVPPENNAAFPASSESARNNRAASPRPAESPAASAASASTTKRTTPLALSDHSAPRLAAPTPAGETTSEADSSSTPTDEEMIKPTGPTAPPTVDILKAQSSSAPHDGKLDMVLMATAHEADHTLTPLQVTAWNVDGVPQRDRTGGNVTSGQLALTLPSGKHRVGVTGTARGVPVQFETDVNVQIKSQGDVTVKGREQ